METISILLDILSVNFGFWLNLLIPFGIAAYLFFKNKEYSGTEFRNQSLATLAFLSVVYSVLFYTTTDIIDNESYNSNTKYFQYDQEWTERYTTTETYSCGSSKHPRTCTRTVTRTRRHPNEYFIKNTIGERIDITYSQWKQARIHFGADQEPVHRSGKISFNDGKRYISIPNKHIPVTTVHPYNNIVVAVNSVLIPRTSETEIKQYKKRRKLVDYPGLVIDRFGAPTLNRVIDTTGSVSKKAWKKELDKVAARVGKSKQANPIIYITDEPRSFARILKAHWKNGKKNDVVLLIGISKDDKGNNKIEWTDTLCWTDKMRFITNMESSFYDESFDIKLINKFENIIKKDYKRKPFKDFDIMKNNLALAWYWQLLILVINIVLSTLLFKRNLNN